MPDKKLLVVGVRHNIDEPSLEATVNFINELSPDKKVSIEYDKIKEIMINDVKNIYSTTALNSSKIIKLNSIDEINATFFLRHMGISNLRLFFYEVIRHLMRRNISFEVGEDLSLLTKARTLQFELNKLQDKEKLLMTEAANFDHSRIPAIYHLITRKKIIEEKELLEIRKKITILEQKYDEASVERSVGMFDQAEKNKSDILIAGGVHAFDLERTKGEFVEVIYLPKSVVDTIPTIERESVIKKYLERTEKQMCNPLSELLKCPA